MRLVLLWQICGRCRGRLRLYSYALFTIRISEFVYAYLTFVCNMIDPFPATSNLLAPRPPAQP